ncbi:hypothetical protein Btru_058942 [Bulinus truncatus]|nr:hypothetical protein Btru_058942 [Bulinus truncatus]
MAQNRTEIENRIVKLDRTSAGLIYYGFPELRPETSLMNPKFQVHHGIKYLLSRSSSPSSSLLSSLSNALLLSSRSKPSSFCFLRFFPFLPASVKQTRTINAISKT